LSGTNILLPNQKTKSIQDILVGDLVISYNEKTDQYSVSVSSGDFVFTQPSLLGTLWQ
jgi:predicted Mrr-cat superfamily restriction endonuclease